MRGRVIPAADRKHHDDEQVETCTEVLHMQKLIALLTHFDDHIAAPACWDYFGSFGDDIFSDDDDDPVATTVDQSRATAARARLVTERRTLNRSQHRQARVVRRGPRHESR